MTPTPETKEFYKRAITLACCVRGYAQTGAWEDAQRMANVVRELWIKVEWQS